MTTRTWTLIVLLAATLVFFCTGLVSLLLETPWTFWFSVFGVLLTAWVIRLWQLTYKEDE